MAYSILILGASYGSLLGMKLALAGHDVTLVCLPAEQELINRDGAVVRTPVRGRDGLVELRSSRAPGSLRACGTDVDPADFDLIGLAMQEPQYRVDGVRQLMARIAASGKPAMSIMNMPPLAYLERLPGLEHQALRAAFTDPTVWDAFEPSKITLASPDPQAFRPPEEPANVLQVSLPTNFKVARFDDDADTAMLATLDADIAAIRHDTGDGAAIELPVKLKLHDSVYVPLAKWAMLLTGNYRCVTADGPRAIREAVHSDPAQSAEIYAWVQDVCVAIGADRADLVPFEKYAAAAEGLAKPSSAARALFAGARAIERVDKLVQIIARSRGMSHPVVDETVALIDAKLSSTAAAA